MWPFDSTYPEMSIPSLKAQYDYIVVGGGNAGCVLARRLSEDGNRMVLLIERGDARDSWLDTTPLLSMHHVSDKKHSTVIQSAYDVRLGRSFPLTVGHGLGGTTRVNGNQYTCGVPAQYNAWAEQGRKGWSYSDIKPYFEKSEHWNGPMPNEYHGLNGPLEVKSYDDWNYGSSRRAAEAAKRLGFMDIMDMHSPLEPSVGFNKMQFTLEPNGRRSSAFRAYIPKEYAAAHSNLHVCTKAIACKIEFSESDNGVMRAVGIEMQSTEGGPKRIITAVREIVLSCGALRTPQLLMLSGVGPRGHLENMRIHVVKHSPGVGEHLQDHVLIQTMYNCPLNDSLWAMVRNPLILFREIYKYVFRGTGWLLSTLAEIEIFGMSRLVESNGHMDALSQEHLDSYDPKNVPDFAVLLAPIVDFNGSKCDLSKGIIGLCAGLLLSKSTGYLRLRSLDPNSESECHMQYLTNPADYATLRAALRVTIGMAREMRAAGYAIEGVCVPDAADDAALDAFINQWAGTMFHYSSSCRMAPLDDTHPGVVDDELRVHGISNLRIADASIIPSAPAVHPQALVYAIAEKCADMMRRDA